jgi:hypothetical protein
MPASVEMRDSYKGWKDLRPPVTPPWPILLSSTDRTFRSTMRGSLFSTTAILALAFIFIQTAVAINGVYMKNPPVPDPAPYDPQPVERCALYQETDADQIRKKKRWEPLAGSVWNPRATPKSNPQYVVTSTKVDKNQYDLGYAFGPVIKDPEKSSILMYVIPADQHRGSLKAQLKYVFTTKIGVFQYWLEVRTGRCRVEPQDLHFTNDDLERVDIYQRKKK